jgi:pimeloyl-ACP methyl ester carboxylesterase
MRLITALDKFRQRVSAETVLVGGRRWRMIDTGGGGPVLVLLPGTLGNADIFFHQIEKLGRCLRILALAPPLIADVDAMADDLARLLKRLGLARASVLGTSFGGFLAQTFAERHPGCIETLFIANSLCDTAALRPAFPDPAELLRTPPQAVAANISAQMDNWDEAEKIFTETKELLRRELAQHLPPRAPKLRLAAIFLRPRPPVPALPDSRIVIIDCRDDPLIPAKVRDEVRARYPGAEHHRLKTGRHFPYLTRTADYNRIIGDRLLGARPAI